MQGTFEKLFINHPKSVDENYFEHLVFAGKFAGLLLCAGFAALVHAIVPGLFEKTASNIIERLHHRMHNRK